MFLRSVNSGNTHNSQVRDDQESSQSQRKLISLDDCDSILVKRREAKKLFKLQNQIRFNTKSDSLGNSIHTLEEESLEFQETDAQVKARITSHLLTGRLQNKVLLAFTKEIEKKVRLSNQNDKQQPTDFSTVLQKSFRKASQKSSKVIQQIPKGIRKMTTSQLPPIQSPQKQENSLCLSDDAFATRSRLLRMQKRRQEREKLLDNSQQSSNDFSSKNFSSNDEIPQQAQTNQAFIANELHYLKRVQQHPERDEELPERIIDQGPDEEFDSYQGSKFSSLVSDCDLRTSKSTHSQNFLSGKKRKFNESGSFSSPLKGLDLATPRRMSTRHSIASAKVSVQLPTKRARRIQINDTVEVYFYAKQDDTSDDEESEFDGENSNQNQLDLVDQTSSAEEEPDFEQLVKNFVQENLDKNNQESNHSESSCMCVSVSSINRSLRSSRKKSLCSCSISGVECDQLIQSYQSANNSHQFSDFEIQNEKKVMTPPLRKRDRDYLKEENSFTNSDMCDLSTQCSSYKSTRRSVISFNQSANTPIRRVLFQ